MQEATIPVAQINLDLTNYRIGQVDGQQEAIAAIIDDQDDYLVHLAEDILAIGLSPAELLIVIKDQEAPGFFTVLEGNRRITALKLMDVPTLAHGTPVYKDFSKLAPEFTKKPIRKVRCVVVDTREEALPWIERRHSNALDGRGQEQWKTRAKANFEADRGKVRRSKAVLDLLKANGKLSAQTDRALENKTTTMDRVFNSPFMRSILGVNIDRTGKIAFDNGSKAKGIALLQRVVIDMARPEWKVDVVRFEPQREAYLRQFEADAVLSKPAQQPATPPTAPGGTSGQPPKGAPGQPPKPAMPLSGGGKGVKKDTLSRRTLANTRKDLVFVVHNQRLNRMYIEARKLKVENFANSASFLLRCFIEMSAENYLIRNKVPLPSGVVASRWDDFGVKMGDKIKAVLADFDPSGRAKEWTNIRQALTDKTAYHSISSMHAFVHNLQTDPNPKDLKRIWEAWQHFMITLHDKTK
jgi:hypothetical protein